MAFLRFLTMVLLLKFSSIIISINPLYADEPLNILLITADDLGMQLGCYGDNAAKTPHLDKLAERSRLFENAYVAQASCSPSRSAMFTGLYPHTNGQYGLLNAGVGFQIHENLYDKTIPALLKEAGYTTGISGKLHVGPEKTFPFDERIRGDSRDVKVIAEKVGEFFKTSDGPFFFMANYSDPHVYGRSPRPPKEAFPTQYKGIPKSPLKIGEVSAFPFQKLDHPEEIERITQYYNACSRFDVGVGLLLDELQASGHADNTLVIFVSDHGPPFYRGKTTCYEAGVKVPMLLHWPGKFEKADRSPALVSTVDILPTILEAAGIQKDVQTQGRSLSTSLDPAQCRKTLATEFHYHGSSPYFPRRSIRDERYKLIHNLLANEKSARTGVDGDAAYELVINDPEQSTKMKQVYQRAANPPEYELYDLKADPWEFDNLIDNPDHQNVKARLLSSLKEWQQETDDPLLTREGIQTMSRFEKQ
ncbi:sulfatase [Rubinisphaera sp.]|uniref:sulfatase family protein n=1 Tax=Rubinisphaera sp. TaxID=2024857 RepID=UPI000C0D7715|nr:sulfatase [Rubinisphaera sp.]MBV11378.1 sulfatase [Rubinisphaera sp.]HCS50061.1 sulfatase [Planctomycetaceae bacterium]